MSRSAQWLRISGHSERTISEISSLGRRAESPERPEGAFQMQDWTSRAVSPEQAVSLIKSGMRVFLHGMAATPIPLIDALAKRKDVEDVRTYHFHLEGQLAIAEPECAGRFRPQSLFTGANLRKPLEEGRADFMPVFLSDVPAMFCSGRIPLDAAILQLSPPDKH